ncbi:uncharacterized protein V1477_004606 [Vespula maculifrons]|uniref:Uncharacterized protein n=2 Tax=Vespula TaxID=7451 RepID=A0A834KLB4_VESVU|nr:uncharacterized protein LOC122637627 [Vespula pensylvanica]XP_050845013.1 uncharacterized protein LOC127061747 [Vespula vulgaris]KAF7407997.1 hypothetical protein HZH66_002534 [Vespula vulgaris]
MKLITIVYLTTAVVLVAGQNLDECLQQDSISCVQKSIYRKAKEFFGKDSLEIVPGINLIRSQDANSDGRNARSSKDLIYDQEIDGANDVAERQNVLESFVGEEASNYFTGRSLRINFAPAVEKIGEVARTISDSMPQEIRQAADEIVEGRVRKLKLLKSVIPLLIAAKAKIGALATIAYFFIALVAKKAIFASLISIAISAFIGLKYLWSSKSGSSFTPYNSGWSGSVSNVGGGWSAPVSSGGWATSGSGGWDDGHYAQNQAYSSYHHRR